MSPLPPPRDPSLRNPDELEQDIEETRARLGRGLDALTYKLSPAGLTEEVAGVLGGTEARTESAVGALGDALAGRTGGWGAQAGAFVRRYPVATTLLGLGLGWLVMRSSGRR